MDFGLVRLIAKRVKEYGQGFLFSRPVDNDGVAHLLAQDARRDAEPEIHLDQHGEDVIVSARLVV